MSTVKGIVFMAVLFALAIVLMTTDPFNLNPEGINSESWEVVLYIIPVALFGILAAKLLKK